MRILYVAKHDSGGNDDEGAITYALEQLGHTVERVREVRGRNAWKIAPKCDFLLFHKWDDTDSMRRIEIPRVFWYFDLVQYPDATLAGRCNTRVAWMEKVIPFVHLGFCTDGDWVNQDKSGKLLRLLQGADRRYIGKGDSLTRNVDILMTGIRRGGSGRQSFVDEMRAEYGTRFMHVERGIHQRSLATLISAAKIVVAPDHPCTDYYWSNRVYLTLGFGGFLLHSRCETLEAHYADGEQIVYYNTREELHEFIRHYLPRAEDRQRIADEALRRTIAEHTYTHRCRDLINTVRERLL